MRSQAVVDLAAIAANVATLSRVTGTEVMAVVKADAYGHGILASARAAVAGGASWLGVAMPEEALALRSAGVSARILAWLWTPQDSVALRACLAADVDLGVSSVLGLELVIALAAELGVTANVHLKIDTGLSRNGCSEAEWPSLVGAAAAARATGVVEPVGIWSHLVSSERPADPLNAEQVARFEQALAVAAASGVTPRWRHLANSAGALLDPSARYDLVRPGIAVYGLSPAPDLGDFGLRPAMTLCSHLANVKRVPAGAGIGYNHTARTDAPRWLGLVPLGYGDGIPRAAGNVAQVAVAGRRHPIRGVVAMDQFVIDLGSGEAAQPASIGDEVILFGPGEAGEPTVQEWAEALGTINYEIVTRLGGRVPRVYEHAAQPHRATEVGV